MSLFKVPPHVVVSVTLCSFALAACSGTSSMPAATSVANTSGAVAADRSVMPASALRAASSTVALQQMPASSADDFVGSVGVDTHFNYGQTSYRSSYTAISNALTSFGIRHVQDGGFEYSNPLALAHLAAYGIDHSAGFPVSVTAAQITATLQNDPNVGFVEPQNEFDETAGQNPNWAAQIVAEQKLLYATVKANPAFANVTVLGPSLGHPWNAPAVGDLDAYEDAGSEHDYTCNYNPGTELGAGIGPVTTLLRAVTQSKPMWATEVGYADNLTGWGCALSDSTIAKFDPRTVADRWLAGEPRTYFYQFADMAPGQNYNSMGLVTQDGRPKPQYTALKSMFSLLADRGTPFAATPLAMSLGGNTSNVEELLLQKRDGSYYLLLWQEVPGWSAATSSPIRNGAQQVTLNFGRAPSAVTSYTYDSAWKLGTQAVQPASTMTVPVTDSITFVHLTF